MQLKRLSDQSITELPDNFVWVDEFDFTEITQEISYTLGGNYIINDSPLEHKLKGGRKITLESGNGVGVTRVHMKALHVLSQLPGEFFEITLPDTSVHGVIFDKMNKPVSGDPLTRLNEMSDEHPYNNVKLKFLEATAP